MVEFSFSKKIYYLFLIFLIFLCCGCDKEGGNNQFVKEYEKYNNDYYKLDLGDTSIFRYSEVDEINKIIKEGTGVIFIGSPKDNLSRRVVDVLFSVADNTDLSDIYYIDSLDEIDGIDNIDGKGIPLVLFVLDGEIVSYRVGTVDNKVDLSEDEEIELYNFYSDGVHKVLQDACDESC